jgi:hypothetical protein
VDRVGSGDEQDLGLRCGAPLGELVEPREGGGGELQLVVGARLPNGDRPMRRDGPEDDPAHGLDATRLRLALWMNRHRTGTTQCQALRRRGA